MQPNNHCTTISMQIVFPIHTKLHLGYWLSCLVVWNFQIHRPVKVLVLECPGMLVNQGEFFWRFTSISWQIWWVWNSGNTNVVFFLGVFNMVIISRDGSEAKKAKQERGSGVGEKKVHSMEGEKKDQKYSPQFHHTCF